MVKTFGEMRIRVSSATYHRNGVSGVGFIVARFSFKGEGRSRVQAIATVFSNEADDTSFSGHCAVISLNDDGTPDIQSCWRGDHFESDLRWFLKSDEGQQMMFPHLKAKEAA